MQLFLQLDLDTFPTINLQGRPRNEFRLVTCQEETVVRHVRRLSKSSKRDIKEELLHVLLIVRHADERLKPTPGHPINILKRNRGVKQLTGRFH